MRLFNHLVEPSLNLLKRSDLTSMGILELLDQINSTFHGFGGQATQSSTMATSQTPAYSNLLTPLMPV